MEAAEGLGGVVRALRRVQRVVAMVTPPTAGTGGVTTPAPTVHHRLTLFLRSQMTLGAAGLPDHGRTTGSEPVRSDFLSQVTGPTGEATCPKSPSGVKQR